MLLLLSNQMLLADDGVSLSACLWLLGGDTPYPSCAQCLVMQGVSVCDAATAVKINAAPQSRRVVVSC